MSSILYVLQMAFGRRNRGGRKLKSLRLGAMALAVVASMLTACADRKRTETAAMENTERGTTELARSGARAQSSDGEVSQVQTVSPRPTQQDVSAQSRQTTGVIRGTGSFINQPRARQSSVTARPDGEITLNFVNVDVRDLVRSVLGDLLRVNFVIDPSVQGSATIQTRRPIPRDAVLPALEAALRLNGIALVYSADLYQVILARDASRQGELLQRALISGPRPPGYGIQIVPLKFVNATEMQRVIEPFLAQGSILQVDTMRNLLVIGGSERELATAVENISTFDVSWLSGMSFGVFPLKYVEAKTMAAELAQILGGDNSPMAGLLRIIPVDRMNAVIGISPQPQYLEQLELWIERLDHGSETADPRFFIYFVQNGRAQDVAAVLTKMLGGEQGDRRQSGSSGAAPLDLGLGAPGPPVAAVPAAPAEASGPGANERRPDIAELQTGRSEGIKTRGISTLRITADEANNALLILATPREYAIVESALKKLDIVPLQVLIEASIAEVTLTDLLRYGVQYFFQAGNSQVSRSSLATGAISPQFPGFAYVFSGADIRVVLDALASVTTVNVLSSPQVMVLNNQTATLQVGDQVPIATQSAVSILNPGAPIVNTIQFRDTGVILKVTPRVNDVGLVTMDVSQEVSDVAPTTTSNIDSPTIQQRKINSTVAINDGETIALGGLIRDRSSKSVDGVPFLQDIPLLGELFKSTNNDGRRTELLVLITPRVIRGPKDAREVTEELRRRVRATQPLVR